MPVTKIKEREAWDRGALLFRTTSAELQQRIGELGKSIGPPWRQDEKLASLAGWITLVEAKRHQGSRPTQRNRPSRAIGIARGNLSAQRSEI